MKTQNEERIKGPNGDALPSVSPSINIQEQGEAVVLKAEMPGLTKEDIHLALHRDEVVVTGRRALENIPKGFTPLLQERRAVEFRRSFLLSPEVDGSKMTAKYEQGVLTLTIPKSERATPQKITIE